mmetsp:Transcript_1334/g.2048  ORF Transcript_1334/g.2048 Transcript_1334/m.2048 type:complete len:327 (+) Transcript_1334:542-1522(+)
MPSEEFQRQFNIQPSQVIELGQTTISRESLEEHLNSEEMQNRFNRNNYHLINNNCNNFSNEVSRFLRNGEGIPEHIINLPNELLNSPAGVAAQTILNDFRRAFTQPNVDTGGGARHGNVGAQRRNMNQNRNVGGCRARGGTNMNPNHRFRENENRGNDGLGQLAQMGAQIMNEAGASNFIDGILQGFLGENGQPGRGRGRRGRREGTNETQRGPRNPGRAATPAARAPSASRTPHRQESIRSGTETHPSDDIDVPIREDVRDFVSNAFPDDDEAPVGEKIMKILQKEGYYTMSMLKSISEEELTAMGFKRGWAKRIINCLEIYYSE